MATHNTEPQMHLEHALKLAKTILKRGLSDPQLFEELQAYVALVDKITEIKVESNPEAEKLLREINELHSKIIEVVNGLKGRTVAELKAVHTKGKAILTYANRLPKRLSTGAFRKL